MHTDSHTGLSRQLTGLDVFCIAAGAMISSGLFVLPGLVYADVGPSVILAYILAGILILPALLSKIELSTAMPKAGGTYYFIERSMGSAAGTLGGLGCWFSLSLKSAFALVGIGALATLIKSDLTEWEIKLIAVVFCVFFVVLNVLSVKLTARVQNAVVLALIGLLVLYILRGAMLIDVHRYVPFMRFTGSGSSALFAAAGAVFISFGGLTKVASVAEEVRNPAKNLTWGMILAYAVILLLYGLVVSVTVGLLDADALKVSRTPISLGGGRILGRAGSIAMALAGIFAFVSTANAGILSASRFPIAMSRDHLLPGVFARVGRRSRTPYVAILATGIFMLIVILILDLERLVKVASTMMILLFGFVILACIIMRESRILNYKPTFRSPLYPWLHIAGVVCYAFVLYKMGPLSLGVTGAFIAGAYVWFRIYGRGRAQRKSALIHIVERITAKEIAGGSLGAELREVLRERDNIIEDRFDALVERAEIIDLPRSLPFEEFAAVVGEKLAGRLDTEAREIRDAFVAREEESTTQIRPGLAIPHIIVSGEKKFELLVARCEAGITFVESETPVYAAFVLVGSRDERNFHLRALSAIAQTVQDPNFDRNWLHARSIEELRDILLLAKRQRQG